jgi:uncharacterized protein (DUF302 family)
MANNAGEHGIVTVSSPYSVDESITRIEAAARSKRMLIFLRKDSFLYMQKTCGFLHI